MGKQLKQAYKFFGLQYSATQQDVEQAVLIKTQRINQTYAKKTEKIESNLKKLQEYKDLILTNIRNGFKYEGKNKEHKFEISVNSILTLVSVLVFAMALCAISFYFIS